MMTCRKCNAILFFATIIEKDGTPKPKQHPFDYVADADKGTWRIEGKGAYRGATAHYDPPTPRVPGAVDHDNNPERYTSHFATCPYADDFRPPTPDPQGVLL